MEMLADLQMTKKTALTAGEYSRKVHFKVYSQMRIIACGQMARVSVCER